MNFEPTMPESIVHTRIPDEAGRDVPMSKIWVVEDRDTLVQREAAARNDNDGLVEMTHWYAGGDKRETIYVRASDIRAIRPYA